MPPCSMPLWLTVFLMMGISSCECCSYGDLRQNLTFPSSSVRPVKSWTSPTAIEVDFILLSVVSLDTSLQTLTSIIIFYMTWNIEYVSWNPDSYCGIENIYITGDQLWQPDLYIYEMIDTEDKSQVNPFFLLYNTGNITRMRSIRIVSSCRMNIYKFPFDTQSCTLTFGSYNYPDDQITMFSASSSAKVTNNSKFWFIYKGDWRLINITVTERTFLVGEDYYSTVIYMITIERVTDVYILTLIMPVCFMVLMDIASMFIQVDNGDRLGFKVTILFGFSMLLLILDDMLPLSDTSPLLGIFCCLCMAAMVVSIFGSLVISNILTLSQEQRQVPVWVQIVFIKYLSFVLIFKKEKPSEAAITVDTENDGSDGKTNLELLEKQVNMETEEVEVTAEVKLLKRLLLTILQIHKILITTKKKDVAKSQWCLTASVLDRLILILYVLVMSILFIYVIVSWHS